MATVSFEVPDALVPRFIPPVDARIDAIQGLDIVPKILARWGIADIPSLTPAQKPALVCAVFLWQLMANMESDAAGNAASASARQQAIDDFEYT